MGVSRTSVREALRHLESEGLVEFAGAKGPRVAIITLEDARDIYELRCVLEGLIVQLFTLRAKAKDIKALEKALEENRKALKDGELQQVIDSVQGFYDVLLEGSGVETAGDGVARTSAGRGVAGAWTGAASGAAAAAGLGMTGGADGGRSQATNPQARLRISQRRAAGRA